MTDNIIVIFISSLCIVMIYASMTQGMLLFPVRKKLDTFLPEAIHKPLYSCLICMSSFWGLIAWVVFYGYLSWDILMFILPLGGLNSIITLLVNNRLVEKVYLDDETVNEIEDCLQIHETDIASAHRQQLIRSLYENYKASS